MAEPRDVPTRPPATAVAVGRAGQRGPAGGRDSLRRGATLASALALFPAALGLWTAATAVPTTLTGHLLDALTLHRALVVVAIAVFAVLLTATALAFGAPRTRSLRRIDAVLLASALVLALGRFALAHEPNDEGAFVNRAAVALLHGQHVYGVSWPSLFVTQPLTKTMDGGGDTTFAYPPLSVLLSGAITAVLHHSLIAAPLVAMGAFLIGAVVLWFAVPASWRPLVTLVVLALDALAAFARTGSPVLLAIALLLPVLLRFHRTGAGGRLGAGGLGRAACLGAACASHQLAWFLVPFLLLALYGLRVPDRGHRAAALLVVRYALGAAVVWVVLDLPFILTEPGPWLRGILLPLRQHAVIHGQGLVDIPYLLTAGSGALDLLSDATVALFAALLLAMLIAPARLGPAFAVFPVLVFYLATRAAYGYWVEFAPLWLAVAATVPPAVFCDAWQPRPITRLAPRWRAALVGVLLVPAAVLAVLAVTSPPPLSLTVTQVRVLPGASRRLTEVDLVAVNTSTHPVSPHFASRPTGSASDYWRVQSGPGTLAPGARGTYVLKPPRVPVYLVPGLAMAAFSDHPMTVSNVPFPTAPTTVGR